MRSKLGFAAALRYIIPLVLIGLGELPAASCQDAARGRPPLAQPALLPAHQLRDEDFSAIKSLNSIAADAGQPRPPMTEDPAAAYFGAKHPIPQVEEIDLSNLNFELRQDPNPFPSRPLYFEDINLERYGHHRGVFQPVISGGRFLGATALLPYRLVAQPPHSRTFNRYPYPAGTMAPIVRNQNPLDRRAAVIQAITIVGIVMLIP